MHLWSIILCWVASLWLVDAIPAAAVPDPGYCDNIDKYTTDVRRKLSRPLGQSLSLDRLPMNYPVLEQCFQV